MGKYLVK